MKYLKEGNQKVFVVHILNIIAKFQEEKNHWKNTNSGTCSFPFLCEEINILQGKERGRKKWAKNSTCAIARNTSDLHTNDSILEQARFSFVFPVQPMQL